MKIAKPFGDSRAWNYRVPSKLDDDVVRCSEKTGLSKSELLRRAAAKVVQDVDAGTADYLDDEVSA